MAYPPPTEKQARILWTSVTALAVGVLLSLAALLTLGVAWVVNTLSSVLIPLAIAGVIAYLLDPIVDWFQRKRGFKRQNAIIMVFCIAVLLVGGMVASVVPSLITQVGKLTTEFPKKAEQFQKSVSSIVNPANTLTNSPAKKSSNSGWVGTSPCRPKSFGVFTMPRPR